MRERDVKEDEGHYEKVFGETPWGGRSKKEVKQEWITIY